MISFRIGRHGVVLLLALFVLLGAEDAVIWINRGVVPGVEFFLGALLVLVIVADAIRAAVAHPPPGH